MPLCLAYLVDTAKHNHWEGNILLDGILAIFLFVLSELWPILHSWKMRFDMWWSCTCETNHPLIRPSTFSQSPLREGPLQVWLHFCPDTEKERTSLRTTFTLSGETVQNGNFAATRFATSKIVYVALFAKRTFVFHIEPRFATCN